MTSKRSGMDDRATPDHGSAMRWFGLLLLLGIAAPHAAGALFDAVQAIRFPYEIAYGEGVVCVQLIVPVSLPNPCRCRRSVVIGGAIVVSPYFLSRYG